MYWVEKMGLDEMAGQVKLVKIGALICSVLLYSMVPARAEYLIDVGDTLEISVAGVPELRQRVVVQLDGSISYPLLGATFIVAHLSPSAVRAKVREALPSKVFRQRTPDGRDNVVLIDPDQITINLIEYRPIYVDGDVSKPGEQVYRPLMTVRQAIAVAGGYEIMRFRMNNPFLEAADFRSEYESVWTEFARELAHIWRLKNELGDESKADQAILGGIPLRSSLVSEISRLEAEQLKAHQSDHERQKEFLRRGIKELDGQIGILSDQLKKESGGLQSDTEDLQRMNLLFGQGNVPISRISDARRMLMLSSIQKVQTLSELVRTKRERDDLTRQLEKLDALRSIDLRQELEGASVKLNQLKAKLQAVGEKIEYTALVRSQLLRGGGSKPEIAVVRKGVKGRERFVAEDQTELQPGDTVEVVLRPEHGVVLPAQLGKADH